MAITPTVTVLYDGIKNCTVQLTGLSDGGNGETLVKKVDVKELNPPCRFLAIRKIHYDVGGGVVQLYWEAEDPVLIDDFISVAEEDFRTIGGYQNTAGPSATGNILLTSLGFDSGSAYSVKLDMVKKYANPPMTANV